MSPGVKLPLDESHSIPVRTEVRFSAALTSEPRSAPSRSGLRKRLRGRRTRGSMEVRMISCKPLAFVYSFLAAASLSLVLAVSMNPSPAAADDGSADVSLGVKYLNGTGVSQ